MHFVNIIMHVSVIFCPNFKLNSLQYSNLFNIKPVPFAASSQSKWLTLQQAHATFAEPAEVFLVIAQVCLVR